MSRHGKRKRQTAFLRFHLLVIAELFQTVPCFYGRILFPLREERASLTEPFPIGIGMLPVNSKVGDLDLILLHAVNL